MTARPPLLPGLLLLAVLGTAACDATGPDLRELERNRALWEDVGPASYTYAVERLCYCGLRGPARVTVQDGAVVLVELLQTEGPGFEATQEQLRELFPAVDGLFDILEDAARRDAHRMVVTYDPENGVPIELSIDYDELIVDEELGIRVTEPVMELSDSG